MIRNLLRRLGFKFESDRIEADVHDIARDLIERGALDQRAWTYISEKIATVPHDSEERAARVFAATLVLARCDALFEEKQANEVEWN